MRQQNGKAKSLSKILRAENTILGPEKKKQKEMMNASEPKKDQETKHNIIKVLKNFLD